MYRLGQYLLLNRINQGGMADVFLAKGFGSQGVSQIVAVKCIRPDIASDDDFVSMFVDEAKLAVQLDHVNIARTYDLGRLGDTYYIAMEHVLGRDLRAVLDRANLRGDGLEYGVVLSIVDQVLEGLDYAHRKADLTGMPLQIVHRDVSPHNVLLSYGGEVKLIDFGIAKATTHVTRAQSGVLRGKYGYMSPEQVMGQTVDRRSDIFSTGALLFELLTGSRLFNGGSDLSIIEKVRYCEVYPPTALVPSVPRDLERVVLQALKADPNARFATASDMREAIVEVMLRRYGYKSQRDIGALMSDLFSDEVESDRSRVEAGDAIVVMPPEVPEYVSEAMFDGGGGDGTSTFTETATLAAESARPSISDAHASYLTGLADNEDEITGAQRSVASGPIAVRIEPQSGVMSFVGPPPAASAAAANEPELAEEVEEIEEVHEITSITSRGARARGDLRDLRSEDTLVRVKVAPNSAGSPQDSVETTDIRTDPRMRLSTQRVRDENEHDLRETPGPISTRIVSAARARHRPGWVRDLAIVVGALFLATVLILVTWAYTREDGSADGVASPGAITVTSAPSGAEVLIDGVSVGKTPYSSGEIRAGERSIRVELDGFLAETRTVGVEQGATATLELTLREESEE